MVSFLKLKLITYNLFIVEQPSGLGHAPHGK